MKKWGQRVYRLLWCLVILAFLSPVVSLLLQSIYNPESNLSGEDAKVLARQYLADCSSGGIPRASVWSTALAPEFSTYLEVTLTKSEIDCLAQRLSLATCEVGCELDDGAIGPTPEWFAPIGQAFALKGRGSHETCIWKSKLGSDLYLLRRNSITTCSVFGNKNAAILG